VTSLQGKLGNLTRVLGIVLASASIGFVCFQIAQSSSALAAEFLNPTFLGILLLDVLAYA